MMSDNEPNMTDAQPRIDRGTRLSVEFVIGLMADGWSEQQILADYPGLASEDLVACLAYARDVLTAERVYPPAA